jgi:hypothetical protein
MLKHPDQRISAKDALKHKYFFETGDQEFDKNKLDDLKTYYEK